MLSQIDYRRLSPDNFDMKSKLTIFAITVQFFFGCAAQASDHGKIYSAMAPLHAGQIVSSDEVGAHFEMVPGKNIFKLYVYPMDLKAFEIGRAHV